MAENSASSSPAKPLQPPNFDVDQISLPNPQNPTLSSPVVPPSPSSIDLPQVSSPQLVQFQSQITPTPSGNLDFPTKSPATSQQHSSIMFPTSNFQMQPALQRSVSISRMNQFQQQFGTAMATGGTIRQGVYGGQMSFVEQQQQQLGGAMTRPVMMSQSGQLSMFPSQAAAHFNVQSQMLAQPRQKTTMQGVQFHPANSSGQAMQGIQALGVIGPLTSNSHLRVNGPLSYGQLRLTPDQLRQQLSQQAVFTSLQKLISQSLQRGSYLAAMSPQISGLTQDGPSTLGQGIISQQQWLKQMQAGMPSPMSPSYHIQQQQQRQQLLQQQAFLPQQLSSHLHKNSLGLSQQHISQLVQQQAQLGTIQQHQAQFLQQQLQQLQQLQQHQQQKSLKVISSTASKSLKESQSGTSTSGTNMPGRGTEAGNQLLGKRKIQDLVSQVDSSGKLDLEVEDLLLELADDFIDSKKLIGQSLQRGSSLAAMSPQISGLTHDGPSTLGQGIISQQQWLKQMQAGVPSPVSPSYHIQQQQQRQQLQKQQAFLPQQLSSNLHKKSLGLSQQHISQLVQQQAQLGTTQQHQAQFIHQQLQQLQQLQQHHQQQKSPKVISSTASKSLKGSQSGTSTSGTNMPGRGTEAGDQLLGKRKIQDLVSQVDSSGKLDPEVEDLLLELADDFINSVTTFACHFAKHRKSSTLESNDLLLHLEKNWDLTIPGFLREEQKNQKVLAPIDVHKKRIELVRTLAESQQMKRDAAIGKVGIKQAERNSAMDRVIKTSPGSVQDFVPAGISHVSQRIPRF